MSLPSTLKLAVIHIRCTPRPTICCPCSPRPLSQCLHGNVLHNAFLLLSSCGQIGTCFLWIPISSILACLPEFTWVDSIFYLSYDLFVKCDLCPGTRWSTSTKTHLGLSTPKSLSTWYIEIHHLYLLSVSHLNNKDNQDSHSQLFSICIHSDKLPQHRRGLHARRIVRNEIQT